MKQKLSEMLLKKTSDNFKSQIVAGRKLSLPEIQKLNKKWK